MPHQRMIIKKIMNSISPREFIIKFEFKILIFTLQLLTSPSEIFQPKFLIKNKPILLFIIQIF